jgi:hypothetical protein
MLAYLYIALSDARSWPRNIVNPIEFPQMPAPKPGVLKILSPLTTARDWPIGIVEITKIEGAVIKWHTWSQKEYSGAATYLVKARCLALFKRGAEIIDGEHDVIGVLRPLQTVQRWTDVFYCFGVVVLLSGEFAQFTPEEELAVIEFHKGSSGAAPNLGTRVGRAHVNPLIVEIPATSPAIRGGGARNNALNEAIEALKKCSLIIPEMDCGTLRRASFWSAIWDEAPFRPSTLDKLFLHRERTGIACSAYWAIPALDSFKGTFIAHREDRHVGWEWVAPPCADQRTLELSEVLCQYLNISSLGKAKRPLSVIRWGNAERHVWVDRKLIGVPTQRMKSSIELFAYLAKYSTVDCAIFGWLSERFAAARDPVYLSQVTSGMYGQTIFQEDDEWIVDATGLLTFVAKTYFCPESRVLVPLNLIETGFTDEAVPLFSTQRETGVEQAIDVFLTPYDAGEVRELPRRYVSATLSKFGR